MARIFPKDNSGIKGWSGRDCWCESVSIGRGGEKRHLLYKCEDGFIPYYHTAPSVLVDGHEYKSAGMTMEEFGKSFVYWDEKPTEPYFKDGWPEWEEI